MRWRSAPTLSLSSLYVIFLLLTSFPVMAASELNEGIAGEANPVPPARPIRLGIHMDRPAYDEKDEILVEFTAENVHSEEEAHFNSSFLFELVDKGTGKIVPRPNHGCGFGQDDSVGRTALKFPAQGDPFIAYGYVLDPGELLLMREDLQPLYEGFQPGQYKIRVTHQYKDRVYSSNWKEFTVLPATDGQLKSEEEFLKEFPVGQSSHDNTIEIGERYLARHPGGPYTHRVLLKMLISASLKKIGAKSSRSRNGCYRSSSPSIRISVSRLSGRRGTPGWAKRTRRGSYCWC